MIFVLAHSGEPLALHDVWLLWDIASPVTILLMFLVFAYQHGINRLWRNAGSGRGIRHWRVYIFYGAVLALFIALQSPLEALTGIFFAAHMLQHMLLLLVVAPLLILSGLPIALMWALPCPVAQRVARHWLNQRWLRSLWHTLTWFPVAWVFAVGALWVWHHPALYEAAVASDFIHSLEHGLFLATTMLFWWSLLRPNRRAHQYGLNVLVLFVTMMQGSLLGVLLVFSASPWYPAYVQAAAAQRIDPLQDQQLAGLVMWLPGGIFYTLLAAYYFSRWLNQIEAAAQTRDSRRRAYVQY